MVAYRYLISLLFFNFIRMSAENELNNRREIPYLRAPVYLFYII